MRRCVDLSFQIHARFSFLFTLMVSLLGLFAPQPAWSFPDLIRHGYVNCLNCHVSPSGGGALLDYGRTFSGEGLSTWSRKGEESLFHGLVDRSQIPAWLSVGGDLRSVQIHRENESVREGRYLWMQADVEAAVRIGKLTLDATIGRFQRGSEEPRAKSRRYFAMYAFTDELMLRGGRFTPVYGINLPDHIISTRRPLRFDQGLETYNLEASWLSETWNVIVTALRGPIELPEADQENALSTQIAFAFWDTYKVGLNGWLGRSDKNERQMAGVHATIGFNAEFWFLTETNLQWLHNLAAKTNTHGLFTYNRLGYELHRGVHLLGTAEYWQANLDDALSANDRYGIGAEFFPRPHFDFQLILSKFRTRLNGDRFDDYFWLVSHYYF